MLSCLQCKVALAMPGIVISLTPFTTSPHLAFASNACVLFLGCTTSVQPECCLACCFCILPCQTKSVSVQLIVSPWYCLGHRSVYAQQVTLMATVIQHIHGRYHSQTYSFCLPFSDFGDGQHRPGPAQGQAQSQQPSQSQSGAITAADLASVLRSVAPDSSTACSLTLGRVLYILDQSNGHNSNGISI